MIALGFLGHIFYENSIFLIKLKIIKKTYNDLQLKMCPQNKLNMRYLYLENKKMRFNLKFFSFNAKLFESGIIFKEIHYQLKDKLQYQWNGKCIRRVLPFVSIEPFKKSQLDENYLQGWETVEPFCLDKGFEIGYQQLTNIQHQENNTTFDFEMAHIDPSFTSKDFTDSIEKVTSLPK